MLRNLIGTKAFYKRVIVLTIPIMIQNGITNLVSMVDNIMIGRIGTTAMTGVSVANQLMFVFNLCIFGAVSGAGIFGAQFFGRGDIRGARDVFRFKMMFCTTLTLIGIALFYFKGELLADMYLRGEGSVEDAAACLGAAKEYILFMLWGLIPYTVVQCYSSSLRESGETMLPMLAGVVAVCVNVSLNYVLIFGKFGAPALGVTGAAVATVISRYVELGIVVIWTAVNSAKHSFIIGAFRSFRVPMALIGQVAVKGLPLMLNEALWASGIATLNRCYSVIGLDVVSANTICQTFSNVFSVAFLSFGVAIGILLGQQLGAGDLDGARSDSMKLILFSVLVSVAVSFVYIFAAEFIPMAYNTTDTIKEMATRLMQITAVAMPLDAFANASYFTLRSGGKTLITFLFDSCFVWCVSVPAAILLTSFTSLPILPVYAICQGLNLLKCIVGFIFVKKGLWIRNIVAE
jgi:putative MATE family efflux protein